MRVISLIPSITETLIECGVNVVARTRYCIHPSNKVKDIPIIGGTKAVQWDKAPQADLVILDKEENTKEMAASCPFEIFVMHVCSLDDLRDTLHELSIRLGVETLGQLSDELAVYLSKEVVVKRSLLDFPGLIDSSRDFIEAKSLSYLIWKKPFMCVGERTFVASVLERLGYAKFFSFAPTKYPKYESLEEIPSEAFLLSSEPFPFEKDFCALSKLHKCALVDGESFSWYGIRSIRFLQKNL